MTKDFTVIDKEEGKIFVGCDLSACEGCKGSMFCRSKGQRIELKDDGKINASIGDTVVLDLPAKKTVLSVFISLGLPLLMFPLSYFIALNFTNSEVMLFFAGILGVCIGFLISAIFFRVKKGKFEPRIIDKK